MEENGGKWWEMEKDGGGGWGNWELLQRQYRKCMNMFQEEREMEKKWGEKGWKMGEKWDMLRQLSHCSRSHFAHFSKG